MKFKILKKINIDLDTFTSQKAKLVKPSNKIYEVNDKLAKECNLKERFLKYPNHIEIIEVKQKSKKGVKE